jgi:16S rRNA (adenine1518-N6/adenine1519-N6)-dimethyltransferase
VEFTRTRVTALLRERGITLKKSLGQNYLVDANFLDALVRDAEIDPGCRGRDRVGAGQSDGTAGGSGRARLGVRDRRADPCPVEGARRRGSGGHAAAGRRRGLRPPRRGARIKIVSNLPYGDWQKILLAILAAPQEIASCTLMIQADVFDRMRAEPGTKEYGPMPALLQATSTLKKLRRAGKGLFLPAPRVESTVFRLTRPRPVEDAVRVEARLRELFVQRRKKSAAAGGRRVEQLPSRRAPGLGPQLRRLSRSSRPTPFRR